MTELLAIIVAVFGVLFVGFITLALFSILNGWVLSILWGWFIAPTFHLPPLSIPLAIGISLVVRYLTHTDTTELKKQDEYKWWHTWINAVLYPLVALGIGAIVHCFV